MVCQICGRGSGYYPLCMQHYQLYKKGEVIKCPKCKTYCFQSEGCPVCGGGETEAAGDTVAVRVSLLEKWGKRLYAIAKDGIDHLTTQYDEERYRLVMRASSEIKEIWDGNPPSIVHVSKKKPETWSRELRNTGERGREYSDDSWDISRYMQVLEVAENLEGLLQSYSVDIDRKQSPTVISQIRFVSDRDIQGAWTEMIQSATDRVYIASPWVYGIDQFFTVLSEAKDRGVTVKILVRPPEPGKESEHKDSVRRLNKGGFHVEKYERLHAKMIIVDDKEVYIGSANLIPTSVHDNPEVGICTTDQNAVSDAMLYFEEKWDEAIDRKWG